jgi:hypothetical protein
VKAERPIILPVPWPTLAGALLLGVAMAAVLSGALAQELRLRGMDVAPLSDPLALSRAREGVRTSAAPASRFNVDPREATRLRMGERRPRRALIRYRCRTRSFSSVWRPPKLIWDMRGRHFESEQK